MFPSPRFLAQSLAGLAVSSAVLLAAPAAYADEGQPVPCGRPAVPAVYGSVAHDPVYRHVPAVSHDEWRWRRDVITEEYEYSTVVSPATTESLWSRTVIDQPAVPADPGTPEQGHYETVVVTPAVTVTLFEYVQQQTGRLRWERDGWNGEHGDVDNGKGWTKTGNTRDEVTPAVTEEQWVVDQPAVPGTPAVEAVTHVETSWSHASPGDDWTGPLDQRDVPAVVDTVWAFAAPDGYTATGESRVHDVVVEETEVTSPTAPDGDGWVAVPESLVVVVDVPEHDEIVGQGYIEQVLLSAAVPASDPCPAAQAAAVTSPDTASTGATTALSAPRAHAHGSPAQAVSDGLPETGNPASPWLLAAGAGALAAGCVLVRVGRGRRTA